MVIAKYRKDGFPKEWFLTDFTMEQVEGRLENLEAENARLRMALREAESNIDFLLDVAARTPERFARADVESIAESLAKIREVLGE